VIAHRGASAHAPENTLDAGLKGWEAGAEAWELDVQLTRDGVPVVVHDESLLRTTDAAQRFAGDPRLAAGAWVSDFDDEELRSLDAGSWFLDRRGGPRTASAFGTQDRISPGEAARYASGQVRIPRLRDCLELTASLGWLVNIELKFYPRSHHGLLAAVTREVRASGIPERVLISSFDHSCVSAAACAGVGWATGVLADSRLLRPDRYVRRVVGSECFHASWDVLSAGLPPIFRRRSKIPLLAYTVNDPRPETLAAVRRRGVCGIFSDFPVEMIAALGQWPK
jgi:glycerophosphoryl diester phosphodiesterase